MMGGKGLIETQERRGCAMMRAWGWGHFWRRFGEGWGGGNPPPFALRGNDPTPTTPKFSPIPMSVNPTLPMSVNTDVR